MKVFLSTSNAGSHLDVSLIEKHLSGFNVEIIKWNSFISVEENYEILDCCDVLLIVPPKEKDGDTYNVGRGQYSNYSNFCNSDKNCNLLITDVTPRNFYVSEIDDSLEIDKDWKTNYGVFYVENNHNILENDNFKQKEMKQRWKEGDKITFKEQSDLPNDRYFYGGQCQGGIKGTIKSYKKHCSEHNCYEINVAFGKHDSYYTMLESEFEEWDQLPEKWVIRVTEENSKDVFNWRSCGTSTMGYYCHNIIKHSTSIGYASHSIEHGYTEITYEQFKKYVIKETSIEEWSKDTYAVAVKGQFGCFDPGCSNDVETPLEPGTVFTINRKGKEDIGVKESNYWIYTKNLKWFATKTEAEAFAETLKEYKIGDWVYLKCELCPGNGMSRTGSDDGIYELLEIDESKNPTGHFSIESDFMIKIRDNYYKTSKKNIERMAKSDEIPSTKKNSIHVTTQEQWDFVTKKLGKSWSRNYFNGSNKICILIDSNMYSIGGCYDKGDYYSFDKWCSINDYKMDLELSKDDLIKGEIYYQNDTYIFKHGSTIAVNPSCTSIIHAWSNNGFTGNWGILKKATPHQKKWFNVCIKRDMFISKDRLSKYDDEGNLIKKPTLPYQTSPMPTGAVKLQVLRDIDPKDLSDNGQCKGGLKQIIPKGTITWCNTPIQQGMYLIENNRWSANISHEYFEIDETILEKARRLYPIGTKMKCVYDGEITTVKKEVCRSGFSDVVSKFDDKQNQVVYDESKDKWAEIIIENSKDLIEETFSDEDLIKEAQEKYPVGTIHYGYEKSGVKAEYYIKSSDFEILGNCLYNLDENGKSLSGCVCYGRKTWAKVAIPELGSTIKMITGVKGCFGVNGKTGVVTDEKHTDGLSGKSKFNIKIDKRIWAVDGIWEYAKIAPMKAHKFAEHSVTPTPIVKKEEPCEPTLACLLL